MKVNVTRAFLLAGKRQEVGTSVEVSDSVGRELVASGKAERDKAAPPAPPGPLTAETSAALVKGKAKEQSNAGQ